MSAFSQEINPYSKWVYDYPQFLLAEPTPDLLVERVRAFLEAPRKSPRNSARVAAGTKDPPGRVIMDLGCGSGGFLVKMAARHPGDAFVGFEIRFKRLVKAAVKAQRDGLENVWFARERAENFSGYWPPNSLDVVHVNFPDPWRKKGQRKKRLVSLAFYQALVKTLKPGGRFFLKTDHSGYFLHALEMTRKVDGLRLIGFSNDLHRYGAIAPNVKTEFEQLFQSQHRAVYYLVLEKTGME